MSRLRSALAVLIVSVVLGGCAAQSPVATPSLSVVPPGTTSPVAPASPVGTPSPTLTSMPSELKSQTPSTAPSPSPAPTVTPSPAAAGTMLVRSYFFLGDSAAILDDPSGQSGLVPTLHTVPKTTATARAAMLDLLAGTHAIEKKGKVTTQIPAGVRLLGVSISKGVATVDLSSDFTKGTAASVQSRIAQVVYTLTQFSTVTAVRFKIDGVARTGSMGAGIHLDRPIGRAAFEGWLPTLFVDTPAYNAALGNPGLVRGLTNVFEARFMLQIIDASGKWIYLQPVTSSCGTGCWGTFSVRVSYTVSKPQYGTLKVWAASPKNGMPMLTRSYRVWLTPARK